MAGHPTSEWSISVHRGRPCWYTRDQAKQTESSQPLHILSASCIVFSDSVFCMLNVWSFPNTTWYTKQPEFSLNHLLSQHYQASQPVFLLIIRSSITRHHLCEDHQHQVKMGENNHHSRYIIHSIHYRKNSNPINISEKRKNSGWLLSGNRASAIVSETAAHVRNFFVVFLLFLRHMWVLFFVFFLMFFINFFLLKTISPGCLGCWCPCCLVYQNAEVKLVLLDCFQKSN